MKPLVLASASPRRRALIEALGAAVEVRPSAAGEVEDGDARIVAVENARRKRDAVARELETAAIVLAADTMVTIDGRNLAKPGSLDEAREMIRTLSGRTHEVITGVAAIDTESDAAAESAEITRVTFRTLTEGEIAQFVDAVRPVDRAGAYTVDGPGALLVERYEGCYTNVLGLPLVRVDTLLRELGDGLFTRIDARRARFL